LQQKSIVVWFEKMLPFSHVRLRGMHWAISSGFHFLKSSGHTFIAFHKQVGIWDGVLQDDMICSLFLSDILAGL